MTDTTANTPKPNVQKKDASTKKAADKAKEAANKVTESAHELQGAAMESAQQGYEATRDALTQAGTRARQAAEQQPLLVLAGAVAFGVVLGLALSNNNRRY